MFALIPYVSLRYCFVIVTTDSVRQEKIKNKIYLLIVLVPGIHTCMPLPIWELCFTPACTYPEMIIVRISHAGLANSQFLWPQDLRRLSYISYNCCDVKSPVDCCLFSRISVLGAIHGRTVIGGIAPRPSDA